MLHLRFALLQFQPSFKDVQSSIQKADQLLASVTKGEVDVLVLPEMAFSGYCFSSAEDVAPFLEDAASGPSFVWGSATAQRLSTYVFLGFPERAPEGNFNSAMIISPSGSLVDVYRKHFLYDTDETWAQEGPEFRVLDLPIGGGNLRISPSICMDLNPYQFKSSFEAYEYATFLKGQERPVDIVVCMMSWLDSEPDKVYHEDDEEWDKVGQTINYWAMRCEPLRGTGTSFIACNRIGSEGGVTFTGSSCGIVMGDRPVLIDHATKKGEEVLRIDVPILSR